MARPATGQITEHRAKDGTVTFYGRFNAYGDRHSVTLGKSSDGMTRTSAREALDNILADVRRGIWVPEQPEPDPTPPAGTVSFHEFASEWFAGIKDGLRPKTVETYEWQLTEFLLPFFKNHALTTITVQEVDRYRQHEVKRQERIRAAYERGESKRRPAGAETLNKTIVRLGQILDLAVEYELIPTNPAKGKRRKLKTDKPTRSYLDQAGQISALLDACVRVWRGGTESPDPRTHAFLATLTFAGLRLEEALTLRWRAVDLAGGWITVGEAKTDAGVRKVRIRPALRDVLAGYKAGIKGVDLKELVFPTARGKLQSQSNVRRMLGTVSARANTRLEDAGEHPLPRITPHSLRRTFASVMLAIGEPVPVVMADLGHTDSKMTLNVYAQVMRQDDAEKDRLRALVNGDPMPDEKADEGKPADLDLSPSMFEEAA